MIDAEPIAEFHEQERLVRRLICSWHTAAGQLAVFQGASDEHI